MAFDYKKEYKEFYLPKGEPGIVEVPPMNFAAVRGKGDPNEPEGDYQKALSLLYGVAFTVKMSKLGDRHMAGYFEYVVPPPEGFWFQEGVEGIDYSHKETFQWLSVIRLPEFVTKEDFDWAVVEASRKKKQDFSRAQLLTLTEGPCVQCMHVGAYDSEPETVAKMDAYIQNLGYENDFSPTRLHHEIYLSDARRTAPEKLKTVIRHPIRPIER